MPINILQNPSDTHVRPDEAQKILSLLRERGSYTVIDRITVVLNTKEVRSEATFSNLGIKNIPISADHVKDYDRLLCGGIWCILQHVSVLARLQNAAQDVRECPAAEKPVRDFGAR